MTVKGQDLHTTMGAREARRPLVAPGTLGLSSIVYLLAVGLALIAVSALLNAALGWGHNLLDDWRYGNPRTHHLSAFVGHDEQDGSPTHLIALNLDRQVVIIEVPGGDPSKVRAMPGPYLFGAGEDKTPAIMRLDDINGDTHKDLIVRINDEELVYLNHDGKFQLISAEQRIALLQRGNAR